jgi:hypothetical protein
MVNIVFPININLKLNLNQDWKTVYKRYLTVSFVCVRLEFMEENGFKTW